MSQITYASIATRNLSTELTSSTLSPNITRVWEINSDVVFRITELCEYHKHEKNVEAIPKFGLNGGHEYLSCVVSLNLRSVAPSFERLQCLQTILKYVAHGREEDRRALEGIDGIDFDGRRIVIKDWFVQESRDHKATYLDAVERA